MKDLVIINKKKEAVTSSRILADKFEKLHKNVIAKIEQLKKEDIDTFNGLKIKPVKYKDEKGESRKEYILNRDAFSFFAMGFTGLESNKFKMDFIRAFNSMESWIKERVQTSVEYKVMQSTLKEFREIILEKSTESKHYMTEAKLVNWALKGCKKGGFKGLDREDLTESELDMLNTLQLRNTVLIGSGLTYGQRKQSLTIFSQMNPIEELN